MELDSGKQTEVDKRVKLDQPKFSFIFSDMDGTLLASNSLVSEGNAQAIEDAISRGINVVIATGKARPAVVEVLSMVGLGDIASDSSPGVYLQGLLVYGVEGQKIHQQSLDQGVCREALLYSMENKVPMVAFSQDHCYTMYEDSLVDSLHFVYHEPKANVVPCVDTFLSTTEIQKLLFLQNPDIISSTLRPYWESKVLGKARVVQAQADMLEVVPLGTSKGKGVKMLLDHLSVSPSKVMAIGDGENDREMLQLAGLGVALANGHKSSKEVADVIGSSNDDDGVASAIYKYAF